MNDLDKEIDQFKDNLNEIDKLTKNLNSNNDKIIKIIDQTEDINKLKESIKKEINDINQENIKNKDLLLAEIEKIKTIGNTNKKDIITEVNRGNSYIDSRVYRIEKYLIILSTLAVISIVLGIINLIK